MLRWLAFLAISIFASCGAVLADERTGWKDWPGQEAAACKADAGILSAGGGDALEVLFQNPFEYDRPGNRCTAEACARLLEWIDDAECSIDFAIYGARNQSRILEALIEARDRGVRVRGHVDRDRHGNTYYSSTDEWVRLLGNITDDRAREEAPKANWHQPGCRRPPGFEGPLQCLAYDLGSSWLVAEHASREDFTDPAAGGTNRIMHHKFFVIDGARVWTGSANISDSGTGGYNANVLVMAQSPELAQRYTGEFNRMVERNRPGHRKKSDGADSLRIGDADVELWFSPQDGAMRKGVQPVLANARATIDASVFFLTHKQVTAELIAAHRRGVQVRVIVDATSAKNGYTKHELLREAGIPVKIENWGGKMHAKAAVIDSERLILGSMNWTSAGDSANDENTLIVRSPRLASRYEAWFDGLWQSIPDRWLELGARPDPESRDSGSACFDGADNDFDQLADADDPGCGDRPPALPDLPPHRLVAKTHNPQPPPTHRLYTGHAGHNGAHANLQARAPTPGPGERSGGDRGFSCGEKRYCGEMTSCAEALFHLNFCATGRLDRDGDGMPCETLCRHDRNATARVASVDGN